MLAAIFALAIDFWAWGRIGPTWLGVPVWIGYFVVLSALQTGVMYFWIKSSSLQTVSLNRPKRPGPVE